MSSDAATTPPASAAPRPSLADWLGRDPTVTMLTGLLLIAVIVFSSLAPARFLSGDSLRSIAFQMPELGILALAMMIPLMSGGLNLAIIATANLSALVMAAIMTKMLGPESPAHITAGVIALAFASGLDHFFDRGVDHRINRCLSRRSSNSRHPRHDDRS